ncbi:MAG: homoserine dehydrogenase, partial [Gammaproteobacteria bacterium]|nr:homoserine dehydrogenase [Gammaproteobacteria bacterium]
MYIGILGLGTVGKGTLAGLLRNQAEILRRTGIEILVKSVAVRDPQKIVDLLPIGVSLSTPEQSIADPDIEVIVELIGGVSEAYSYVISAIQAGKHVVTANKELLAIHAEEIFSLAQKHQVMVMFEAAVCGGIPIIKVLREGMAGNKISSLFGIINGTSNYILSQMYQMGRS